MSSTMGKMGCWYHTKMLTASRMQFLRLLTDQNLLAKFSANARRSSVRFDWDMITASVYGTLSRGRFNLLLKLRTLKGPSFTDPENIRQLHQVQFLQAKKLPQCLRTVNVLIYHAI